MLNPATVMVVMSTSLFSGGVMVIVALLLNNGIVNSLDDE